MNALIQLAIRQPITVAVGMILSLLAGFVALQSVSVQMTPEVESVVVSVSTHWEAASPEEIETDVVEPQEQRLGTVSGLVSMTSISQAGQGQVRLEFRTGTDIDEAVAEVVQKLDEVPGYPEGVDEPVVEDIDPESVDYIAWIGLSSSDPNFDATTLYDFMERRLKPRFERIPGVSQVGVRGARESELRIHVDPLALAQRGITYSQLVDAIDLTNDNYSGGRLEEGKNDIRIRSVGRFPDVEAVNNMIIRRDAYGPVYVKDVANVTETYKEMNEWVRARGVLMPFFNYQLESGANLLDTMDAIKAEVAALNAPGGLLEQQAQRLGLNGKLELVQTYDSTEYVNAALDLVQGNILVGGALAVITLLLFLRSLRTIGIIALAIPTSIIGSIVFMVLLGRTVNIISLAGMAFSVGMVVDNAIVVIENIFRHLEMGKSPKLAALQGTQEVGGAVVASTLTTLVVFLPILLIQEQAGQLFRDISLAIMAAVGLSLIVSVTVIPSAASLLLKRPARKVDDHLVENPAAERAQPGRIKGFILRAEGLAAKLPDTMEKLMYRVTGSWTARLGIIGGFIAVTMIGIVVLMPPMDYLPKGNRNIVFSVLFPPPGYSTEQLSAVGERMEARIRPAWEVTGDKFAAEAVQRGSEWDGQDRRVEVPVGDGSGETVLPPPLNHYFLVSWDGRIFQAAISQDKRRVVDALPLMNHSVEGVAAPDVLAFSFQFPLFRTGGTTGSAIKIDLVGDDLDRVTASSAALLQRLVGEFGPYAVTPEPANFLLPTPELRIVPNDERLRELGMTRRDVGLAVQANSDGLLLPRQYQLSGELKDIKLISDAATGGDPIEALLNLPISTPEGDVVDLRSVAAVERLRAPEQIKHADRQRAVTLQFTPPAELPLEDAIAFVEQSVAELREQGQIAPEIEVNQAGSAGALNEIKRVLLGDGTLMGTATSSLFLAFLVVYLVMVVLFQSWSYPVVIMTSVPLATLGGFLGLALIHGWSLADRYMPVQNLDVLTILGFVILAGVVVNNAILIVHQSLNFLRGEDENGDKIEVMTPREAIASAVRSRVRPILMSTLTSVGGMLPLVLMPGSGSELYRGLGAVVTGGLAVSTVFTLVLVPLALSVLIDVQQMWARRRAERGAYVDADSRTA
ncbi:MAG: hydrophobic/amphiphilic exporter-1 (mainly G- bacteria) HAE1 family [Puniceicoccaceae bacterium 5H]|nr:MAG: hydrophobic/amphiphilic exporter-1 (mainly G- bacteria) HAE1 family [Puniceicoccaceae bacterium 5H]